MRRSSSCRVITGGEILRLNFPYSSVRYVFWKRQIVRRPESPDRVADTTVAQNGNLSNVVRHSVARPHSLSVTTASRGAAWI